MWCPEGYLTLFEVHGRIIEAEDHRLAHSDEEIAARETPPKAGIFVIDTGFLVPTAYHTWLLRSFIDLFQSDIRVATPSGAVLRPSSLLFQTIETWNDTFGGYYFSFPSNDAEREIAGAFEYSFISLDSLSVFIDERAEEKELNPFFHLSGFPLCILEDLVPVDPKRLVDIIIERQASRETAGGETPGPKDMDIASKIVAAYQAGTVTTKNQAAARFGKGMKVERWRAIWHEVTKAYPNASKPGPRSI